MKIAITGASGIAGRFLTRAALRAGHEVTTLGRTALGRDWQGLRFTPWSLGETPVLTGQDALIHAAFRHRPGRYRGGEGDDPAGFRRDNLDGSLRLAEAAASAGVGQMVFLSSRAVFDGHPAGTLLTEDLPVAPDSLYGEVKVAVEDALAAMNAPYFRTASLRATGIYGQAPGGPPHKWAPLFAAFMRGEPIEPRIATEVHGDDLARAVLMLLAAMNTNGRGRAWSGDDAAGCRNTSAEGAGASVRLPPAIHISDLVLDRSDLLARYARHAGLANQPNLPDPAPVQGLSILDCPSLRRLGWSGGGIPLLERSLAAMAGPPP